MSKKKKAPTAVRPYLVKLLSGPGLFGLGAVGVIDQRRFATMRAALKFISSSIRDGELTAQLSKQE